MIVGWHNVMPTLRFPLGPKSVEGFRAQVEALDRWGTIIPLSLLSESRATGCPLPPRAVVLTFDDGYADNLDVVAPLLADRGLPATFFLATEFLTGSIDPPWEVGNDNTVQARFLDWNGAEELLAMGFEVGSHTCTHPRLSDLDDPRFELEASRAELSDRLGVPVRHLAYPFGSRGDYTQATEAAAARAGYELAITSRPGWNTVRRPRFALRRFFLDPDRGVWAFDALLRHAGGQVRVRAADTVSRRHTTVEGPRMEAKQQLATTDENQAHAQATSAELAVIIPCHDAEATLAEQLDALLEQDWDAEWEIVVVDNASTDRTRVILDTYALEHPRLRVVTADDGTGAGYARNVGVAATTAPMLAFCDADDVVGPRWVATMGTALRDHAFVTGPVEYHRLNRPDLARHRGSFASTAPGEVAPGIPHTGSCNFGVQREAIEEIGGLSPLPVGEDAMTSYELWRAGIPLHWEDDALLHYRFRESARERWHQARAYGEGSVSFLSLLHAEGVAVPSRWQGLRSWAWLVRTLPRLRDPEVAPRWQYTAGYRLGRIEGSIRQRTFYL